MSILSREFPVETFPPIIRADKRISRTAIKMRLSAIGCPHGRVEVVVAALKAGAEPITALHLGMLAYYAGDEHGGPDISCIERIHRAMLDVAKLRHCETAPWGKCAEERAAQLEGRPSRWNTPEMLHNGSPVETKHYPYKAVKS